MITVLMSCTQTFGATVQNTQNVKTYIYGFNISNTEKRWTGKADRQIKINTISSSPSTSFPVIVSPIESVGIISLEVSDSKEIRFSPPFIFKSTLPSIIISF